MSATPLTVDFGAGVEIIQHASGVKGWNDRPKSKTTGLTLTPKQIRARLRRKQARWEKAAPTDEEIRHLYKKPIEEWDLQELARGRPKNAQGHFNGPKPTWITTAMHEEAMQKYTAAVKGSMRATTVDALSVLQDIITNTDIDDKGRPFVPANTRLDATKFLIEHVIGKPTQRIENDVSVKLQGILGQVMVNPAELATGNYMPGHFPGMTMALAEGNTDDDDDLLPADS